MIKHQHDDAEVSNVNLVCQLQIRVNGYIPETIYAFMETTDGKQTDMDWLYHTNPGFDIIHNAITRDNHPGSKLMSKLQLRAYTKLLGFKNIGALRDHIETTVLENMVEQLDATYEPTTVRRGRTAPLAFWFYPGPPKQTALFRATLLLCRSPHGISRSQNGRTVVT